MTTGAQLLIQGRSHLTAVSIIISHLVTFLILYPDKIVTLHQLSASIAVTLVTSRQQIWSWHRIFVSKTDIDISCLNLVKWSNQCRISTSFVFVCSWKEQFLGRVTQRSQSGWPAPKTRAARAGGDQIRDDSSISALLLYFECGASSYQPTSHVSLCYVSPIILSHTCKYVCFSKKTKLCSLQPCKCTEKR